MRSDVAALEQVLGWRFRDQGLLALALTHSSQSQSRNNERLEFLGDSVLGFLVSSELFRRFPDASEGELTRARSRLVREATLAQLARRLGLGEHIRLGPGSLKSGDLRRDSVQADALEAVLGAVYMDGGLEAAAACLWRWYDGMLDDFRSLAQVEKDAKTQLQEWLQARGQALPAYRVIDERGPDHARVFRVSCAVAAPALAVEAEGASRRIAEQKAAAALLQRIREQE